jgi:hypothetical protein
MNQVPHSGPTNGRRHCTKFIRPGHQARCICAALVSVLRVVTCVTSYLSLPPCSHLDLIRYVVSLLLLTESHPRQPTGPSEPVFLAVSFCQPFIITRHSSWLSKCSTSPNIPAGTTAVLECPLVSTTVPARNCVLPAVCSDVMCALRRCGPTAEMCCC